MLCLSGFELYSRWVPLSKGRFPMKRHQTKKKDLMTPDIMTFLYECIIDGSHFTNLQRLI